MRSDVAHANILVVPGARSAISFKDDLHILDWAGPSNNAVNDICLYRELETLGAAGLLKGFRSTTHWAALDRLKHWDALLLQKRVVEEGKIMMAAGVPAGIDMGLRLAEKIGGQPLAEVSLY